MKPRRIFLMTRSKRFLQACLSQPQRFPWYKALLSCPFRTAPRQFLLISGASRHGGMLFHKAAPASISLLNQACLSRGLYLQALPVHMLKFQDWAEIIFFLTAQ